MMTIVQGVLLAPGAGSDRSSPTLVALEDALAPLPVRRMDFPYRKAGRRAPDRAPVLLRAVREEAEAFAAELGCDPAGLALGGRSMGGRMCSMAVAEGLPAAGLVLISYPLHPPGKPEKLRTDHLAALRCPCLFVSGDRDPFGSPAELEAACALVPGPVTTRWVEGGRHDLGRVGDLAQIVAAVKEWLAGMG
ncbi:MAG: alpha/beta family hydrolase [Acidimicrobiales bacterium]